MPVRVEPLADDMVDTRDPFEADAEDVPRLSVEHLSSNASVGHDYTSRLLVYQRVCRDVALLVDVDPYEGNERAYGKAVLQFVADVRAEQKRER